MLRTPPRPICDPQVGFNIFLVLSVLEAFSFRLRKISFETNATSVKPRSAPLGKVRKVLYTKKPSSYRGTGEVGPWRIKRRKEKPILLADVVFILQPRLGDIDNNLTSQMDKKIGMLEEVWRKRIR